MPGGGGAAKVKERNGGKDMDVTSPLDLSIRLGREERAALAEREMALSRPPVSGHGSGHGNGPTR